MDTLSFKTISANKATVNKEWVIVDAEGQTLGRLCAKVAKLLRGKYKPNFTPHVDCGDNVIIINAEKVVLTGKKLDQKMYYRHTGYIGNMKKVKYSTLMKTKPEFAIQKAVKGMIPDNTLGRAAMARLRVYKGSEHKHAAQKPVAREF